MALTKSKGYVLAVMAHPDDAELRCFGTLSKYVDKGYSCIVLIICSGENGISIEDREKSGRVKFTEETRIQETITAFKDTGIEVRMLHFEDGSISCNRELIVAIETELKIYNPEIVITHFPDQYGADHQDHSAVGKATINCATRLESVRKILMCEPLMALRTGFQPNYFVDITEYFERKIRSLECHKTQMGRFYLEREFHENKSLYYASNVSYEKARQGQKYESFALLFAAE